MTSVPVEVIPPASPAIAESFEHPMTSDLLGDADVFGKSTCPWPQVSTLAPATADPTTARDAACVAWDIVDEWGDQSFPASDPPANW